MNITNERSTSSGIPEEVLDNLSSKSKAAVERLLSHETEIFDLTKYPTTKLAAVLVLLYEKSGELHVLLTTRSKKLRSHPGQTALPGGKCDETDVDVIDTAYREANEEVNLPLRSPSIHALCLLRPSLSKYHLLVTPVVSLLSDLTILNSLVPCEGEVEAIFEHPLEAILDPSLASSLPLAEKGGEHWPYEEELYNMSDTQYTPGFGYRMHRLRSTASPIKGLTADILIMAAEIAYARKTIYDRWAPGQVDSFAGIVRLLEAEERKQALRRAVTGDLTGTASEAGSKHASREHLPSV